jgi:myo-inositol-1(or 4)-monophosphatase
MLAPGELRQARDVACTAARAAGSLLLEKLGSELNVRHKGIVDLVTDADRAAEQEIVTILRRAFPEHDILAEEQDYGLRESDCRWIVDPLDGTTNYAHGFPWFAVSIALEVDREIACGVVYQPWSDELFTAIRDQGAFLNDLPLKVSSIARLDQALLATGFPYDRKSSDINNYDHFVHFQQEAQACRRPGAASLDLACVAAGRFDGYWEMKLKPWDVAAGLLLVTEAGGAVTDFDGSRVDIYGPRILASNGRVHGEMIALLQQGKSPV